MAYCELLLQINLGLLEIIGWLIDAYLAIVYLPTNIFIKKNSQNYFNFYVQQLNILFRNELNTFKNTRARMLDSIYHVSLRLLSK